MSDEDRGRGRADAPVRHLVGLINRLEAPGAAGDYIRNEDSHGERLDPADRDCIRRSMADNYCATTGPSLPELGRRQMTALSTAQRWATGLSTVDPALADARDIRALSTYLERGHAAGYPVLDDVRRVLADDRRLGEHPGRTLMVRLSNVARSSPPSASMTPR